MVLADRQRGCVERLRRSVDDGEKGDEILLERAQDRHGPLLKPRRRRGGTEDVVSDGHDPVGERVVVRVHAYLHQRKQQRVVLVVGAGVPAPFCQLWVRLEDDARLDNLETVLD